MPCLFCGYEFDQERLGKYGCPDCLGEGIEESENNCGTTVDTADNSGRLLSAVAINGMQELANMKTITEYMDTTFSGEFVPFTENTDGSAVIQLESGNTNTGKSPHHSARTARRIVKQMRADGWLASLRNGIVFVKGN